jgi:23S rRNA (uracil1939-C5)-methyltransferase
VVEDLCDAGERFDAVVVNPPRHGLPREVREGLARLAPRCLAYVSCDPSTLARDLGHFAQLGLRARGVEPFDMMPLSESIECFTLLEPAPAPPLRVVYEDEQLLVVDKPPHLPTTPQAGRTDSVLSRAMRERGLSVLHAVHRLDQETSGLCLLAKRSDAVAGLSSALARGEKRYLALARGVARPKGIVRMPLVQDGQQREAVTRYTRLKVLGGHSLVRARPEHGRTHQVRRHLASLGHPVLGDTRHGDPPSNRHFALAHGLDRTFLHLERLELVHPVTAKALVLEAALAPDLAVVLDALQALPSIAAPGRRRSVPRR